MALVDYYIHMINDSPKSMGSDGQFLSLEKIMKFNGRRQNFSDGTTLVEINTTFSL